jgi:L-fuconolactonase
VSADQVQTLADAHVHFFAAGFRGRYGRASSGGDDLAAYQSLRDEHRIDTVLALAWEGAGERHYKANNEYVARIGEEQDWVAPLMDADLEAPRIPPAPFLGMALYLMTHDDVRSFALWPQDVIDEMARRNMLVSVNAVPATLNAASDSLHRLAGCRILVSHLGQPGRYNGPPSDNEIASDLGPLLSLARLAHVGVKLSGLYDLTEPTHAYPHHALRGIIDRIASAYGTERLYWGSDFSPVLDHVSFVQAIDAVSDLPWSPDERTAIMGGNLRGLIDAVTLG